MRLGSVLLCGSVIVLVPATALAGEDVLRGATPAWVDEVELDLAGAKRAPSELLADWQHRIEDGVVHSYADRAIRIDNPQTLMDENILSLSWLPDKGDLTVHRLEIHRDGQVIDLLADAPEFEIIRRELGLEARLIDGELTATLPIPGLKVGDILRTSHTTSIDDQALGEEVQVLQYLGSKPWRVGRGRAVVSWPQDEEMFWAAEELAGLREPELRDGYKYLTVELPLAEPREVPADAPSRYARPTVLRVGSFADWSELSSVMAPHFYSAADVAKDSDIARQAEAIMAAVSDPLERTERAVRLVQDEVSYLLNGLDGGNYLPQRAEDTWAKRYGDCKAKSVLLLALLRRMGIDAEPVLVVSRGGDALPQLLPVPGDFDHVIVRARIEGADYWLDGTSTGTRLSNIGNVPPFHHALPLRAEGADLAPMLQRDRAVPDMRLTGTADHSAGIDLPQLFAVTMEMTGPQSAYARTMADLDNPDTLREMAAAYAEASGMVGAVISSLEVAYDEPSATGRVILKGVSAPSFRWENGRVVMPVEENAPDQIFNPDRARPDWRTIPVATPGPFFMQFEQDLILPLDGKGFSLSGASKLDAAYANTRVTASAALAGRVLHVESAVRQGLGEIAPADVSEAKRAARRFVADAIELVAPEQVTWRWDLDEEVLREKVRPILAAYDQAIAFAPEDNFAPLMQKAYFLQSVYDYAGALAAYDRLVEMEPSAQIFVQRSGVQLALGRRAAAIADLEAAYEIEPSNQTGFALAREMAYAGDITPAMEMLETLPVTDDERIDYADAWATVAALQGDTDSALSRLEEEVADKPENPAVLNAECWFRGLFNVALEDAVTGCTRAVERAEDPTFALDSRAMVQFRLGKYDEAITDLNTVLTLAPALAPSRYLRGVVLLKKGDEAGKADVAAALRMEPQLAEFYGRHGVAPEF
jgi:tetratricopeptide (TPR) repeat protein